jgi:hypothetical protein
LGVVPGIEEGWETIDVQRPQSLLYKYYQYTHESTQKYRPVLVQIHACRQIFPKCFERHRYAGMNEIKTSHKLSCKITHHLNFVAHSRSR